MFFFISFTLKNGFHECSFSSVNPWIHRFAAKGNSKMKKKSVRLSNRQPSSCCSLKSSQITFQESHLFHRRNRCLFAPTKSRPHLILLATPIQFGYIFRFYVLVLFLVYSSIIISRSNKNRSIRTVIDSVKIAMKAARTRTYWTVKQLIQLYYLTYKRGQVVRFYCDNQLFTKNDPFFSHNRSPHGPTWKVSCQCEEVCRPKAKSWSPSQWKPEANRFCYYKETCLQFGIH